MGPRSAVALTLALALLPTSVPAGIKLDVAQEVLRIERGELPQLHIPGATIRVAVFTYEDPDETGLGDAIAAMVGQEILLKANVGSVGVLRYEGRLSGTSEQPLSYFDKVDKVTSAQDVTLSVWGAVRRDGESLVIDTYAQLPADTVETAFKWQLHLPADVLPESSLVAHLRPDRIHVQRLAIAADAAGTLRDAAARLDELHAEPLDSAAVTGSLPRDAVYRIAETRGDWTRFVYGTGQAGWARTAGQCAQRCGALLDAAHFVGGLLRFTARRDLPDLPGSLSTDAMVVRAQLQALESVDEDPALAYNRLRDLIYRTPALHGSAALANVLAITHLALSLVEQKSHGFDVTKPAHEIAFELAGASQVDPRNRDVLHNLGVLFRIAGDDARAQTAEQLAANLN